MGLELGLRTERHEKSLGIGGGWVWSQLKQLLSLPLIAAYVKI